MPILSGTLGHISTSSHELLSAPWVNKLQLQLQFYNNNPILQRLLKTCSKFSKTRRTHEYVRRFVQNAREKNVKTGPITLQESKDSENQLFKWSQIHLQSSVIDEKFISSLDNNGIIRAYGRLEDPRWLPQEMRNPAILPSDHLLVQLLLRHLHGKRGHCGYKSLIHEDRRN